MGPLNREDSRSLSPCVSTVTKVTLKVPSPPSRSSPSSPHSSGHSEQHKGPEDVMASMPPKSFFAECAGGASTFDTRDDSRATPSSPSGSRAVRGGGSFAAAGAGPEFTQPAPMSQYTLVEQLVLPRPVALGTVSTTTWELQETPQSPMASSPPVETGMSLVVPARDSEQACLKAVDTDRQCWQPQQQQFLQQAPVDATIVFSHWPQLQHVMEPAQQPLVQPLHQQIEQPQHLLPPQNQTVSSEDTSVLAAAQLPPLPLLPDRDTWVAAAPATTVASVPAGPGEDFAHEQRILAEKLLQPVSETLERLRTHFEVRQLLARQETPHALMSPQSLSSSHGGGGGGYPSLVVHHDMAGSSMLHDEVCGGSSSDDGEHGGTSDLAVSGSDEVEARLGQVLLRLGQQLGVLEE